MDIVCPGFLPGCRLVFCRMEREIKISVSGTYRLGLEGNDGYQLTVDGKVLVDKPYKTSFGHTLVPFTFEKEKNMTFVSGFMRIQKRTYPVCLGRGYKNEDQSIEQAVQAARESEIAIVVVGIEEENSVTEAIWHCLAGRKS